jgi:cytochrome P450
LDPDAIINAKEMKSYRHILTFSDGPRTCLGKGFALAEFKVCCCCGDPKCVD